MRDLLESPFVTDDAAAIRAEWRAEEEQWSRAAFERWEHDRALADIARDCMHRGDSVAFAFADVTWSGEVVAVGRDIARVETGDLVVDVRLAASSRFVLRTRPSTRPGRRGDASVTTFQARLRQLDSTRACIGALGAALEGTLRLGRDQVRVAEGGGAGYLPIGSVDWVRAVDVD